MAEPIEYLTKEKYEALQKELEDLKTVKRKEVADSLEYAKSLGDLSENAEYHEARELQASIEDRIGKLEEILKSASILSGHETSLVGVGSTVTIEQGKTNRTFTLVSSEEIDVKNGKISVHSPVGEAVLGKKKGDTFNCRTPKGTDVCRVLEIK
jgi:transcription elongation factor GreA